MKTKVRYRVVVVDYLSVQWHELTRNGWLTHRVHVYSGGAMIATMIRRRS